MIFVGKMIVLSIFIKFLSVTALAKIEVHGHRGARAILPENTIPAFDYALEVGVDVIELDMAVTKDKHVIVNHDLVVDTNICKYKNPVKPIYELTLKEIKKIDCGSIKNPRFPKQKPIPGTKIPTLDEVFSFVKNSKHANAKTVQFNIETKSKELFPHLTPSPMEYAKLVNKVIKKHKLEDRVILQSFDIRTLQAMKKVNPKIKLSFLYVDIDKVFTAYADRLGMDIISPYHKWLSKKLVTGMKKKNMKVMPWTANTEADWKRLIEYGVDGIITDDPKALISYLKKKGLR